MLKLFPEVVLSGQGNAFTIFCASSMSQMHCFTDIATLSPLTNIYDGTIAEDLPLKHKNLLLVTLNIISDSAA